jgi:MinD-like ATPase involved in chromosome partitioning or flagellar assembly
MRIIALGSGSSGTGKTTIAARLGAALGRLGPRVCLADLNLSHSDLHLVLGLRKASPGLLDFLDGRQAGLESAMVAIPGSENLWVIPGADETVRTGALSSDDVQRIVAALHALPADLVVLDLAPGFGQSILDLFAAADTPLVVSTPDAGCLEAAGRFVRMVRLRHGARSGSDRARQKPKVYTSLEDLVRDLDAVKGHTGASRRGANFNPQLIVNRSEWPDEAERKRWRREYKLDLPVAFSLRPTDGLSRTATLHEDATQEHLQAFATSLIVELGEDASVLATTE